MRLGAGAKGMRLTSETQSPKSQADLIEIITTQTGHFDILDAWWDLLSKGMSLVTCKMAVFSESGEIVFTGKKLKLCG